MLFNSYIFLFGFMPIAVAGFHVVSRLGRRPAASWLIVMSFLFYGWWNPSFTAMLLASIALNYIVSVLIGLTTAWSALQTACLGLGIGANLAALFYYKYFESLANLAAGFGLSAPHAAPVALPLGISFFTFTQIGYLVDVRHGETKDTGLINYVLFVTFFPHLIAGPILHHREIMPQFGDKATYRFRVEHLVVGLSIFVIGLGKKCVFADSFAAIVDPAFQSPSSLGLWSSWLALLSYQLQLYFDFSGYSDMAVGIAWMFNIEFPVNFNSPLKAASIIDRWQRWHITLTRYLNLYLYNPIALAVTRRRMARGLGISRKAQATAGGFASMVAIPTLITMILAGIWHGAGLQFVIFGVLHGAFLTINHAWRIYRHRGSKVQPQTGRRHCFGVLLTFTAALLALAFFRAPSVSGAISLLCGLIGLHGIEPLTLPTHVIGLLGTIGRTLEAQGCLTGVSMADFTKTVAALLWLTGLYFVVLFTPNSQQIMAQFYPTVSGLRAAAVGRMAWQPTRSWALGLGMAATMAVLAIGGTSEFLYFKF